MKRPGGRLIWRSTDMAMRGRGDRRRSECPCVSVECLLATLRRSRERRRLRSARVCVVAFARGANRMQHCVIGYAVIFRVALPADVEAVERNCRACERATIVWNRRVIEEDVGEIEVAAHQGPTLGGRRIQHVRFAAT